MNLRFYFCTMQRIDRWPGNLGYSHKRGGKDDSEWDMLAQVSSLHGRKLL